VGEERARIRRGTVYCDPWSDRRVAEYVRAIPQHAVNRRTDSKRLARRAIRGLVPPDTRTRLGKLEPNALFYRGFSDQELATVRDLIGDPVAARMGFVDGDSLRSRCERYLRGEPTQYEFWWPLTLEMWLRAHWI
jgi:asparagine synthase (glutamine-hydrolysing)